MGLHACFAHRDFLLHFGCRFLFPEWQITRASQGGWRARPPDPARTSGQGMTGSRMPLETSIENRHLSTGCRLEGWTDCCDTQLSSFSGLLGHSITAGDQYAGVRGHSSCHVLAPSPLQQDWQTFSAKGQSKDLPFEGHNCPLPDSALPL